MARDTELGFALLGLLHQVPRSGYDLRKAFATTPLGHFSDSPGAIYPALRRLLRRGWIDAVPGAAPGGRRRQAYRPTAAGRRAFRQWLRARPTPAEVGKDLDAQILRLAFLSEVFPASAVERRLGVLREAVITHLAGLERFFAAAGPQMTVSGRVAFESGLDSFRSFLRWTVRAQKRLRAAGGEKERRT
jgi:DNA-binding PadR family transcriptional regulator